MLDYQWDPVQRIFIDQEKKPVAKKKLLALLLLLLKGSRTQIMGYTEQLRHGSISIDDWRDDVEMAVISLYISAGILAFGAVDGWSHGEQFVVVTLLDRQLGYLDGFENQIRNGEQGLDGAVARSGLYADSGFGAYQSMVRDREEQDGMLWEMRVLDPGAESCGDCIELAGKWAPIGTLPEIGDSECMANCRCEWAFTDEMPVDEEEES